MIQNQLIWGAGILAVLSLILWVFAAEYRSRLRYIWTMLAACFALLLVPQKQPWMHELALALIQFVAIALFSTLLFRMLFRRFGLPVIVGDVVVIAGYAITVLSLLARVGVNVSGLIATSAVVAAVIGLALQELLVNVIGGLALHSDGSIHNGVWIKSEHGIGQVRDVKLRHTVIETAETDLILIPNHSLMKVPVTIISNRRRTLVKFRLGLEHRPTSIIKIIEKALRSSPIAGIAGDPQPECLVVEAQAHYMEYGIRVWVTTPGHADLPLSRVLSRAYFALERAGAPLVPIPAVLKLRRPKPEDDEETTATAALRQIPMWPSLTSDELQILGARLKRISFAPGETIVSQGDSGSSMFVILGGSVSVTLAGKSGDVEQLATLEAGSFFGEMSLMTGSKRTASIIALEEVECGELEKQDVADILRRRPELVDEISDELQRRQTALASVREMLEHKVEKPSKTDLLTIIQYFFGISKQPVTPAKEGGVINGRI
jgi:small-conductance mechanosensitive channel